VAQGAARRNCSLLAHDDTHAATPAFRESDARCLPFGRQKPEKRVRYRMKAKRRRNEIDERRSLLEFATREISVAGDDRCNKCYLL
jgi:hypothetical protein